MSAEDCFPLSAFYNFEVAQTTVDASVQNFTDARSFHATVGVDPAVAIDLSHGLARASAQSQFLAAEVEATRTQAEQSQEQLKAAAQAAHEGIVNSLRADHVRELASLREEASKAQRELQGRVNEFNARISHAEALCRQTDGARQAAEEKGRGGRTPRC